jgi:hypothetical protein
MSLNTVTITGCPWTPCLSHMSLNTVTITGCPWTPCLSYVPEHRAYHICPWTPYLSRVPEHRACHRMSLNTVPITYVLEHHAYHRMSLNTVPVTGCPWTPCLSPDIPTVSGLLCDKAQMFGAGMK